MAENKSDDAWLLFFNVFEAIWSRYLFKYDLCR